MVPRPLLAWKMPERLASSSLAVPRADDVLHAQVECALRQPDEEPQHVHLGRAGACGKKDGEKRPCDLHAGIQIDGRSRVRRRLLRSVRLAVAANAYLSKRLDLPGYLSNDISHRPARLHVVEFIPPHAQILLHAGDKGVVDIDLVEVLDEVSQRCERQWNRIELH